MKDSIAAIATAEGVAALSIVRVSGRNAIAICARIFRGRIPLDQARARTSHYGAILDGGETIDEVVATVFRAPHSYTGEDLVELTGHGGYICPRRVLGAALKSGARLAEPGEFTERAFLNGRIDLSQAESVAALIQSRAEATQRAALRILRGGLREFLAPAQAIYRYLVRDTETD